MIGRRIPIDHHSLAITIHWRSNDGFLQSSAVLSGKDSNMSISLIEPRGGEILNLRLVLWTVAVLGLLFQVGHFFEHAFQFVVWLLGDLSEICGRDTPWVSAWVSNLIDRIGLVVAPEANAPRRWMLGLEVLHLIGNSIFFATLGLLYYLTRNRWVRWGLYIEAFHLYEHVMLTYTVFFVGKPIGLSTLFGQAGLGGKEFAVGVRVTWHFVMNLLPIPFAMIGLMEYWDEHRPARSASPERRQSFGGPAMIGGESGG
jgi:hypothetical protein